MESHQDNNLERHSVLCEIIPTYNEAENIEVLISKLEAIRDKLPYELRILVVDDNSTDGTPDIVKKAMQTFGNIGILQRPFLAGIGSAYVDGFRHAIASYNADYLGEIDADLQHPPEVLIQMCEVSKQEDVVVASRYVKGGGSANWSLTRRIVSKTANILTKIFLRIPVSDSTSGFRVMSRKAVESLLSYEVSSKGYSFQVESLYAYKKSGMTFAEVPYVFQIRQAGKTKLNWKEVVRFAGITIKTGVFGLKKKA
ncbi:MAG: polyprenol monophosphomannose synthase [Nitrososphaerota archaeon]|nr:polyprenol monophosphomannose synthase [Nitrososphaerota archaeon]